MTALTHLLGLLLLAYLGNFLVGSHAIRGFGLPSSVEYVVLGFLLGPVLGLVDRDTISQFNPLTHAAVGWLALVVGLGHGYVGGQRVRGRNWALAMGGALLSFGLLFGALWLAIPLAASVPAGERTLLAAGVAVACTETTRHAVRWVVERYQASGPLSSLIAQICDADDAVPILISAVLFSVVGQGAQGVWALGLQLGLGVGAGLLVAALLGREFRVDESWRMLLGASMLAVGLALRAGLPPLATMFVMGMTLSATSRHREEIVAMTAPTERAVLLPALLVAGARLDVAGAHAAPVLLAVVVLARLVAKSLLGALLWRVAPEARAAGPWLGLGLMSTGGLAVSLGLAFDLQFKGALGDTVLVSAAAVTLLGEFLGPAALRAALARAGELRPPPEPS